MSEGLVHPYKSDGEAGVNLFRGTVRSMSPGVMCRGIWKALPTAAPVSSDGTTPSRPWDIWPDQLAGGLVPKLCLWGLTSPPPHSSCLGLWHPITHEHLFCPRWGLLKLCQCFSHSANCVLLPPVFWSRTSVKAARKWWLFHTAATFVPYHTLYLLSESRLVFPFAHVVNYSSRNKKYLCIYVRTRGKKRRRKGRGRKEAKQTSSKSSIQENLYDY